MKINAHAHLLPYPNEIPAFMREKEIFWIDEDKKFMRQKGWKRPITADSFFLKEKLLWMEKHHINHAVLLNLSQLYGNGLSFEETKAALSFQNDFNAALQSEHPTKFTCGFVVHAGFLDWALAEIERCVTVLGLQLLCLPTHYLDKNEKWQCIFNKNTEPIFELANKYGLAVEIHPYDGEKFIHLPDNSWRFHLIWMLAQCADAYHFYTLNGYFEQFPNMRVCFAHGGQLNQVNLGRRIQGFEGRPDLFQGKTHPKEAVGHPNIFFDTLVHDILSFELLIKRQKGTSQIVWGLDDPYPLGEMDDEKQQSYPGKLLDLAVSEGIISKKQQQEICNENVIRWLCGENDELFLKRIKKNNF